MAASNADTAFGADLLKEDSPGAGTYTTFGVEITNITPPNITRGTADVTHHSSPGNTREFIATIMDGGEVSLEINYIPSDTDAVLAALKAGKASWQIMLPNDIAWTFDGIMTSYSPSTPLDGGMAASITFKVSGMPVLSDES